jgi:hypothetical protein
MTVTSMNRLYSWFSIKKIDFFLLLTCTVPLDFDFYLDLR